MTFSTMNNDLEAELKQVESRKDILVSLLHNGIISQNAYDLMENKTERLTTLIKDLNEILKEERSFWKSNCSEETRILEVLLVEFKIRHLLGEIGEEEWKQKSKIIGFGLNLIKEPKKLSIEDNLKAVPSIQLANESLIREEIRNSINKENELKLSKVLSSVENLKTKKVARGSHSQSKLKKRLNKEILKKEDPVTYERRCLNPWKTDCRNTNIELSIYYNGKLTPICRNCWEEISNKNIEWTGL